jgi:hypothetical protein
MLKIRKRDVMYPLVFSMLIVRKINFSEGRERERADGVVTYRVNFYS